MKANNSYTAYSIAIFSLYKKEKKLKNLYLEAKKFQGLLENNFFFQLLVNFNASKDKIKEFILKNLNKEFDKYFLNFILIIVEKHQTFFIKKIISYLIKLLVEELKIKKVDIYFANNFSDNFIKKLVAKELKFKDDFIYVKHIDKSLIGGYKIVFENKSFDKTIKNVLLKISDNF